MLHDAKIELPKNLTIIGDSLVNDRDVETISTLMIKVQTTDRGAPEYKAIAELDKVKESEMTRTLGRRLIKTKALLMLRASPSSSTSAHIQMKFVGPSFYAHGVDWDEDNFTRMFQACCKYVLACLFAPSFARSPLCPLPSCSV